MKVTANGESAMLLVAVRDLSPRFRASPVAGTVLLPSRSGQRESCLLLATAGQRGHITMPWFTKVYHCQACARIPLLPLSAAILGGCPDAVAATLACLPASQQLQRARAHLGDGSTGGLSPVLFSSAYIASGLGSDTCLPPNPVPTNVRLLHLSGSGFMSKTSSEDGVPSTSTEQHMRLAASHQGMHVYTGEHAVHALAPLLLAALCGHSGTVAQLLHEGARVDTAVAYPLTVQRWGEALVAEHSEALRARGAASPAPNLTLPGAVGFGAASATPGAAGSPSHGPRSASDDEGDGEALEPDASTPFRGSTFGSVDPFSAEAKTKAVMLQLPLPSTSLPAAANSKDAAQRLMDAADAAAEAGTAPFLTSPGLPDLSSARSSASLTPGFIMPRGNSSLVAAGSTLMHIAAQSGSVLTTCIALADTIVRLAADALQLATGATLPPSLPEQDLDPVLASVFTPRPSAVSPSQHLQACMPGTLWKRRHVLRGHLPHLAAVGGRLPSAATTAPWTASDLNQLQRIVSTCLDVLSVRMLLTTAGAFPHWRPAASVCLRDSPFPTERILQASAGLKDPLVCHVLWGLAAATERRSITQHTPIHSLTRCVTPHPHPAVLEAYSKEEGEGSAVSPPIVPQAPSGHALATGHMPSSVSDVAGQQPRESNQRSKMEYWRDVDTYTSQISTQSSVHLGRMADRWRHQRTSAEDKHGLGHLAQLEQDLAAQSGSWGQHASHRMAPPVRISTTPRHTGRRAAAEGAEQVPTDYAAPLPGLQLSSLAQASLALTSFAVGAASAFDETSGLPGSASPLRCLLAPVVTMSPTGPVQSRSGMREQDDPLVNLQGLLRDNFYCLVDGVYSTGVAHGIPVSAAPPLKAGTVASDSRGYMVDYMCILLRSVTALHMRRLVQQATGQELPLNCAGGTSAAGLGLPRPAASGAVHRPTLPVAQALFDAGGLPLYGECGSLTSLQTGSDGDVRTGVGKVPDGSLPATELQSLFGVAALLSSCSGHIPAEALASSSMSDCSALNKLLVSAAGMQAALPKEAEHSNLQQRCRTSSAGSPTHTALSVDGPGPSAGTVGDIRLGMTDHGSSVVQESAGLQAPGPGIEQRGPGSTLSGHWEAQPSQGSPHKHHLGDDLMGPLLGSTQSLPQVVPASPPRACEEEQAAPSSPGKRKRRRPKPALRLAMAAPAASASESPSDPDIGAAVPLAELKGRTLAGYAIGSAGGKAMLLTPTKVRQLADDTRSTASWDLSSQGSGGKGGGASGHLRQGSMSSHRSTPHGAPMSPSAATGGVAMSSGRAGPRRSGSARASSGDYGAPGQRSSGSFVLPKYSSKWGGGSEDADDILTAVSSD